jgi:hypothetical protein
MSKPAGIGPKYIETTFTPTGESSVEAHGFKDGACRVATKEYEEALGVPVARDMKIVPQTNVLEPVKLKK